MARRIKPDSTCRQDHHVTVSDRLYRKRYEIEPPGILSSAMAEPHHSWTGER
jgi:hypothetical protein